MDSSSSFQSPQRFKTSTKPFTEKRSSDPMERVRISIRCPLGVALTQIADPAITLRLPGRHSLWSHVLWNASRICSKLFDRNTAWVKDKRILELGAGSGLPSIVAAKLGASTVVTTDYPDKPILDSLEENMRSNGVNRLVQVCGYIWGKPPPYPWSPTQEASTHCHREFDAIVASDLIFNHSQHRSLLSTIKATLADEGVCLVLFSHHIPNKAEKDLEFFRLAREEFGFQTSQLAKIHTGVMFEEDHVLDRNGLDLERRQHVFIWALTHGSFELSLDVSIEEDWKCS